MKKDVYWHIARLENAIHEIQNLGYEISFEDEENQGGSDEAGFVLIRDTLKVDVDEENKYLCINTKYNYDM